jgi:uncharacterized protein (TIGR03435 family)
MARMIRSLILIALCAAPAAAQQPLAAGTDGETFEVASIRPAPRARVPVPEILPGGVLQIGGVTLSDLIRFAYPTANGQVIVDKAPGWVMTDRFDVIAKTSGARPSSAMLRALLAERFQLRVRLEPREGTVFELKLLRNDGRPGPGLTTANCGLGDDASRDPAVTGPCQALRIGGGPTLIADGVTIADLARTLTYAPIINAPVIDRTGWTDRYNFRLRYRADNNPNLDAGPSLPTALEEQLGLKLHRTKGTIDVVVIEHVEKLDADSARRSAAERPIYRLVRVTGGKPTPGLALSRCLRADVAATPPQNADEGLERIMAPPCRPLRVNAGSAISA